ncbi:MAG: plasmid recombination protein [Lachnospiraceae bacterium]|nr:plasmid recombination protein [Lachnospiraceae bacterium]
MITILKRTISVEVGKGSTNHNSRKFNAKNTDPERTPLNTEFCNDKIKTVYHELFDDALKRNNEKQTRKDRIIPDYYEHIRAGKQEKLFHEIIIQIGNREDTGATTEIGKQAAEALTEYYNGFQERNPHLRVFSAHLHMDEATPHLHVDFVPFISGSKRGLDTRVSLKQALAAQGFKGGTRRETEWSQWVLSEKETLAEVMERHGFEWEQKGTHEKHLSVYDYEKKMRTQEVAELTEKADGLKKEISDAEHTVKSLAERITDFENSDKSVAELQKELDTSQNYNLPDPSALMTAKSYKNKFVDPVINALKKLIKTMLVRYFKLRDEYNRVLDNNGKLWREGDSLKAEIADLKAENKDLRRVNSELRQQNKDHAFLRRIFGNEQIDGLLKQAKEIYRQKKSRKGWNKER